MNKEPLKLCMLSGSFEYESESSLTIFRDYMEREHPVRADLIVYRSEDDHKSLAAIEETDVLLVFTRRLNVAGEELERFKAYCREGGPIVGVRTASHSFQNWLGFDREVLGGNYDMHWEHGPGPMSDSSPAPKAIPPGGRRGVQLRGQSLPQQAHRDRRHAPHERQHRRARRARHLDPHPCWRAGLLHVAGAPGGLRRAQLPPPARQRGPVVRRETVTGGHAHIPFGE